MFGQTVDDGAAGLVHAPELDLGPLAVAVFVPDHAADPAPETDQEV